MRKFVTLVFWSLVVAAMLVVWAAPSLASSIGPDTIRHVFDANAIAIMFVWGLLHKYVPALEKLENDLIPWASAIGYVLAKLFPALVGTANASVAGAVGALPDAGAVILAGATNSVVAALLYDKFGRVLLDRMLRRWTGTRAPLRN